MTKLPLVAIVGRQNAEKSTFFNKIAGSKISILRRAKAPKMVVVN